jgi:hypothetical protein
MGMQSASIQQSPNPSSGKGMGAPLNSIAQQPAQTGAVDNMAVPAVMPSNQQQPRGKGGNVTMPQQGGQPRMGMPNAYSNTIQPWDNASIQTRTQSGKGKGY